MPCIKIINRKQEIPHAHRVPVYQSFDWLHCFPYCSGSRPILIIGCGIPCRKTLPALEKSLNTMKNTTCSSSGLHPIWYPLLSPGLHFSLAGSFFRRIRTDRRVYPEIRVRIDAPRPFVFLNAPDGGYSAEASADSVSCTGARPDGAGQFG